VKKAALDLSSGKGMLVGFCSAAGSQLVPFSTSYCETVHKALENSSLRETSRQKQLAAKLYFPNWIPSWSKINLIRRINLWWLKNYEVERRIKIMQYFEGITSHLCLWGNWSEANNFWV